MKLFIVNLLAGTNWTHHLPSGVYVDIYIELHATFGLKLKPFQDTTIKIHGSTPTAQSVADLCTLQLEFGKSCIRCLRENYGRKLFCTVSKPLLKYERRSKFNFTTIVFLKFTYCSRLNGIRIGVIFVSLYFCLNRVLEIPLLLGKLFLLFFYMLKTQRLATKGLRSHQTFWLWPQYLFTCPISDHPLSAFTRHATFQPMEFDSAMQPR